MSRMGARATFAAICLLVQLASSVAAVVHEVNEAAFLHPTTNSTTIRCPLSAVRGSDIQWYDVGRQRYERDRGRYYRIHGLQPFHREVICSSALAKPSGENADQYKFIVRTYGERLAQVLLVRVIGRRSTRISRRPIGTIGFECLLVTRFLLTSLFNSRVTFVFIAMNSIETSINHRG